MEKLDFRGVTANLSDAGLAAGTTTTYVTTATTAHVIDGNFGTTLAAQTNTASPTTDVNTSAAFTVLTDNQACVFVWGVNAAGAIKVAQGTIEDTEVGVTTTAGSFRDLPQFPSMPNDFCPIGYTVVRTAPSASDWTFGSSNWTATGITATFKNVCTLPARPQST
jgi:hypothetical protein